MREVIRAVFVALLGRSRWSYLVWYRERFGLVRAIEAAAWLPVCAGLGRVKGAGHSRRVFVRPGTADQHVYDQVFVTRDYDVGVRSPRVIVDAGAHIGLATIYFAQRFPSARIIAIEPESRNHELLVKNVRGLGSVSCVNAGLWSRSANLKIVDTAADTWGFTVTEVAEGSGIPAIGIAELLREYGLERIDLLKMDIEGSEVEVLSTAGDWLNRVDTLLIELHDRFRPGCTRALELALAEYEYELRPTGDSLVISHLRKRAPAIATSKVAS